MNIDEAIKYLQRDRFDNRNYYFPDFQQAIDLGIEALKVVIKAREGNFASFKLPLPGETDE